MINAKWPAPSNIKAFTTTRLGGVSESPFSSNNLGNHVGDNEEAVTINRERLNTLLPNNIIWLEQTHSTNVCELNESVVQSPSNADAVYTTVAKQVCCVMTADCLPILMTNTAGTKVAAVHAGWRGLADGIIANSIATFDDSPDEIIVWFGPAIGPKYFEVGQDVYDTFIQLDKRNLNAFVAKNDKYLANIYQLALNALNRLGVSNISGGEHCTYEEESLFFSYRRDGQTGRMASVIWLDD